MAQTSNYYYIQENNTWKTKVFSEGEKYSDVLEKLGYNKDMYRRQTYLDDKEIFYGVFRQIFTGKIILIYPEKTGSKFSMQLLSDINANYKLDLENKMYSEKILTKGCENGTLSIEYLKEVMSIPNTSVVKTGDLKSEKFGYILSFKNGLLTSFKTVDGLGYWARFYKDQDYFKVMKKYAEDYWGKNNPKVIWEINTQCDARAKIPGDFDNEDCGIFSENNGTICNAKIMIMAFYDDTDITENDFKAITHNKARFKGVTEILSKKVRKYVYMHYQFFFNLDGSYNSCLVNIE